MAVEPRHDGGEVAAPIARTAELNREIRARLYHDVLAKASLEDFPDRRNTVSAWYGRMMGASRSSDRFKRVYYWLYLVSALAAATVPALIAAAGSSDATSANVMRFFAAGLGVVVAIATSVLGVVQFGNRWRVYRAYGQALEDAGWAYIETLEADAQGAYRDFVTAISKARAAFQREYLAEVAVQAGSPAPATNSP